MKITSKGQITIPSALREKHGLRPHTDVQWIERDGDLILKRSDPNGSRGTRVVQALRGKSEVGMTTDQILALTRDRQL